MNTGRGVCASYTTLIHQKLKVGDKLVLPTIWGKCNFKVTEINNGTALVESGETQARLKDEGSNGCTWRYNHVTWPKNMICKVTISDYEEPSGSKNWKGFKKVY